MADDDIAALEKDPPEGKERNDKGQFVPKIRLDEVLAETRSTKELLQQEREARIRLEEQLKALAEGSKQAPQKVYTRAELNQMVEEGKISKEQADEYLDQVREVRLKEALTKEIRDLDSQRDRVNRVKAEMNRYKELVPDVLKQGSEERAKVTEEYNYLVSLGHPADATTELAALRAAYGPVERLEKRKNKRGERETFQDAGGRNDGGGGEDKEPKLPQRYKEHYQRMIDKGMYKGWDDPVLKKELARLSPETIARREKKYG